MESTSARGDLRTARPDATLRPWRSRKGGVLSIKSLVGPLVAAAGVVGLLTAAGARAVVPLDESLTVGSDAPAWSPDGKRLAYVGFRRGRFGDIFVINADGRNERRLTTTKVHEDMPRWSPDGRRIAFVRELAHDRVVHLFVMNADGSGQTQLTSGEGSDLAPSWAPDGSRIAFVSTRDGNAEIYVMNADGTGQTRLTRSGAVDNSPDWSPDGRQIAFSSNRTATGITRVFVMDDAGNGQRQLTNDTLTFLDNEFRPAWSPDGATVAFVSERNLPVGNSEIYAVNADGTNIRRVTHNRLRDDWPAWSPDSRQLAVARGPSAFRPEIFVIAANGGSARKVTGGVLRFVGVSQSGAVAGRLAIVELAVRPALDRYAEVGCAATLSGRLLEVSTDIRRGRVRCTVHVPSSAKGKRVRGLIGVRVGGSQVTRQFALVVR